MRSLSKEESNSILLELADLLDTVEVKKFKYSTYIDGFTCCRTPKQPVKRALMDTNCGTVACAAGYSTLLPRMKDRLWFEGKAGEGAHLACPRSHKVGFGSVWTIAVAFTLTLDEAAYLFLPMNPRLDERFSRHYAPASHATPKEVALHIRNFVRER